MATDPIQNDKKKKKKRNHSIELCRRGIHNYAIKLSEVWKEKPDDGIKLCSICKRHARYTSDTVDAFYQFDENGKLINYKQTIKKL